MGIEEGTLTVWDWASRTQGISGPIALGSGDLGALSTDLGGPAGPPDVAGAPALASLGRYPVAGSLGRGGMGEVILVRDPDLGRELAAKVILQSQPDRVAVEKFLLEAQVTGQLEHPNIVPVHELGLDAGRRLYMTMKRVRGKDLKAILDEERKASERGSSSNRRRPAVRPGEAERARSSLPRLLEIFLKVCDAVAFAHSKGVIHRDLKPANVMVGEFGEVLVMDWGLAKVAGHADPCQGACVPDLAGAPVAREARSEAAAGEEPLGTLEGSVLGTPAYMPPEQARGEIKRIDERSDIYSLGAILYEILTLAPPFTGSTPLAVLEKVKGVELFPPSRRAPERTIPRELEAAVLKAMSPDPAGRYATVGDFKRDIEAWFGGRALAAARYNPFQRAFKWAKRNKAAVLGSGAALVALGVGLAVMAYTSRARRARDAEELNARAEADWVAAEEKQPFNPASPQEYFRSRIAALTAMGRSLSAHPAPPGEWKELVASRAAELQEKAQDAGDWALAQVLANLPREWGAVGETEAERRAEAVNQAFADTVKDDRDRLNDALTRVRDAEGRSKEKEQGALVPGEVQERARRLARSAKTPLAGEVLTRLVEAREPPGSIPRRLLVELLGRTGDVQATAGKNDVTAPRLVVEVLSRDRPALERLGADEIGSWLVAAARLYLVAPTALPDIENLFAGVAGKFDEESSVAHAVQRARKIAGVSAHPDPDREDLGDWLAAAAASGSKYTKRLIELAQDETRLSTAELVLVYDQLGMVGQDIPPEPGAPRPSEILQAAFEALPDEWLPDEVKPDTDTESRTRAREKAIHAAIALSRIEDLNFAQRLYERRYNSEQVSTFWNSTELAFALAPQRNWPEPRTAEEYIDRGNAHQDRGDLAGAVRDFDRAIELKPHFADAYNNRGNARQAQGDLEGAIQDHDCAIGLKPDLADAYNNRGIARKAQGDLAGAIRDYDRAIELKPDYAIAYSNRSNARRAHGDLAGAVADCDRAIELKPDYVMAYSNRALARGAQGDLAGAIQDCDRAIELEPDFALAYSNRGNARQSQGDLAGAIRDYDRAIELDPDDAATYSIRGSARKAQGDFPGAIRDYDRAIELKSDEALFYSIRGIAREFQGDLAGAIQDYDRAIELKPDDALAYSNRGIARETLGDLTGAIQDYDRAIELRPDDALAHSSRGLAREAQGDLAGAIRDYDRAIELKPDADAYYNRGFAREAQGDLAGAIGDYDRAIELKPDHADAYYNRGLARQAQGDIAGAIGDYDRAIELKPDHADAYYNRGLAREAQGDHAGAIGDYGRAIELKPDDAEAYSNRGNTRAAQGDFAGAMRDYDRAIELDPRLWQAWSNRGLVVAQLGRKDEARESFEKALSCCPENVRATIEAARRQALGE